MTNTLKETYFVPPVPLAVAKHLRYFEEAGLEVDSKTTRSSNQQREDLLSGERDVAVTAIDNLLIWNEGQDDFRLIAQVEQTTSLTIYARPGLQSIGDLAGTRFAVDAATNGFAIVARHLLADAGVGDVDFVEIGGVRERLSALLDGPADATLLGPPFDEMAEQAGLVKLLVANDLLGEYPGQGLVVRTSRIPELRLLLRTYVSPCPGPLTGQTVPPVRPASPYFAMPALAGGLPRRGGRPDRPTWFLRAPGCSY